MKDNLIEKSELKSEIKSNNTQNKSFLNNFFFFRFLKLFSLSKTKKISFEDINIKENTSRIEEIISDNSVFTNYQKSSKKDLLDLLFSVNKSKILYLLFLNFINIALLISTPFIFKRITLKNLVPYSIIIIVTDLLKAYFSIKIQLYSNKISLCIDSQIKNLIIKNELTNKNNSFNNQKKLTTTEKISLSSTIFNNDIENIKHYFDLFPNFITVPLLFISYYLTIYYLIGISGFSSLLLLILIFVINIHFQGKLKMGQKNKQGAIDERMQFMTILIHKIKSIKILSYEKFFYDKILSKRENELDKYRILFQTTNKIRSLLWISPTTLLFITITVNVIYCMYYNQEINVKNLLIIFGLIDSMQLPILSFSQTYSFRLISKVSIKRIQDFISSNNNDIYKITDINDVNLKKNEIIFIIGDTGSGKSFLLKNIYNQYLNKNDNNTHLIYTDQEPFIINDTIISNIFFMKNKNLVSDDEYKKILDSTCLNQDLFTLQMGDSHIAGEGGASLSGGQKKRICIARALLDKYYNKEKDNILFFDDPTSSLDPETVSNVWNKSFANYLKDCTRVITTNNLELIKYGDRVLYVEKQDVIFNGSYDEFKENHNIFDKYLKLESLFKKRNDENSKTIQKFCNNINNSSSNIGKNIENKNNVNNNMNNNINLKNLYSNFIKIVLGGFCNFSILFFILFIWIICRFFSEYSLVLFKNTKSNFQSYNFISFKKLLLLYIVSNLLSCILLYTRLVITSRYTINGGRNLHKSMLNSITNVSIQKSNLNISLLINNFSRDLGMVDFFSSVMFGNCFTFGGALIIFCAILIIFFKICIIFIPIVLISEWLMLRVYLIGLRQLRALEAQMRTGIIKYINEVNFGSEAIKYYNISDAYLKKFNNIFKKYCITIITVLDSNAWFSYASHIITIIFKISFIVYYTIQNTYYKNENIDQNEKIGIMFVSIFSLHEYCHRVLNHYINFENSLLALQRCIGSYSKIPQEEKKSQNLENYNISKIKFEDVSIKYNTNIDSKNFVLNNISFSVNKGEKIGICGKTGVGKTTLLMSLLKIVNVNLGKIIFNDDKNLNDFDATILRQKIVCVTQDISLFDELTIKENIDPFNKHQVSEILNEFKELNDDANFNLENIINKKIKECNLSFGQKNIICFLRILLKCIEGNVNVILLDEMTDKSDYLISEKIINLLFNKFPECIFFIVSHRMNSFEKCDKVMVMKDGKIAEFDEPKKLLADSNSIFNEFSKI